MPGGQTRARVILLKPDDGGVPFVAKIDAVSMLGEEMRRFSRFIKPWERHLNPELHVHGSIGVILFGLVEAAGRGGTPAPTLYDLMRLLCAVERGAMIENEPTAADIRVAVLRTIEKLAELSSNQCNADDEKNLCWLGIEPLYRMRERGITYSIDSRRGAIDVIALCEKALQKVAELNGKAIVHGDAHGRNVLVRDREPFLIDYAYSGPGHPCFDLVRIGSSLLFSHFRMTSNEERLRDCFAGIFVEGKSFDEISKTFPDICTSAGSHIALEAVIWARAAALKLAQQYGGSEEDYLAVKFVVACQSLTIPDFQSGVVRATLMALAPVVQSMA